MATSDAQGASYEAAHVHSVYEEIASHFSSTRYKVCVARQRRETQSNRLTNGTAMAYSRALLDGAKGRRRRR
jgi:hypothetical protein